MKRTTIFLAIAISLCLGTTSAQSLKSLRGSWGVERNENTENKKPVYPAQEIYDEAMKLSSGSNGVNRDINAAFEKYLKAADLGNPLAQNKVGACYYYGSGVDKNPKKAFQYWTKASNADIAEAHYELGRMYYYGEECKRNYNIAISLFRKAEVANIPESYYMLGLCYLDGNGIKLDKQKAIEYFNKAASRGNHDAKYKLKELEQIK